MIHLPQPARRHRPARHQGTHIVRTGVLRDCSAACAAFFAEELRQPCQCDAGRAERDDDRLPGRGTATCLIVASFVGKGLVTTAAALAVILGADVGAALMAVIVLVRPVFLSVAHFRPVCCSSSRAKTHSPAHVVIADRRGATVTLRAATDRRRHPTTDRITGGACPARGAAGTRSLLDIVVGAVLS
jgi:hypothetical protein